MGKSQDAGSADASISLADPERPGLEAVFRRYGKELRRLVSRVLVNAQDNDDVVQEAFLNVWRRVAERGHVADTHAYVFQSVMNTARSRNRQGQGPIRHGAVPIPLDLPDPTVDAADEVYFRRQRQAALEQALSELPVLVRGAFVLHHMDGMSVPKIALGMNKSERTVARYIATAVAHCVARTGQYRG